MFQGHGSEVCFARSKFSPQLLPPQAIFCFFDPQLPPPPNLSSLLGSSASPSPIFLCFLDPQLPPLPKPYFAF